MRPRLPKGIAAFFIAVRAADMTTRLRRAGLEALPGLGRRHAGAVVLPRQLLVHMPGHVANLRGAAVVHARYRPRLEDLRHRPRLLAAVGQLGAGHLVAHSTVGKQLDAGRIGAWRFRPRDPGALGVGQHDLQGQSAPFDAQFAVVDAACRRMRGQRLGLCRAAGRRAERQKNRQRRACATRPWPERQSKPDAVGGV